MVKIRLSRGGTKKKPYYHVIICDSRKKRDCRSIDIVGSYNPIKTNEDERVSLDEEKLQFWYKKGAQPSDRVAVLIKKKGIQLTRK